MGQGGGGSWELEAGSWKLEVGSWELEDGVWRLGDEAAFVRASDALPVLAVSIEAARRKPFGAFCHHAATGGLAPFRFR